MKEICEIIGRLIAVLIIRGALVKPDDKYILGQMTLDEWTEKVMQPLPEPCKEEGEEK